MFDDGIIGNRYRTRKVLSSGESSGALLVTDTHDGSDQVLKWTKIVESVRAEELLSEFSLLISLSHPMIVRPIDLGIDEKLGIVTMTTAYIPGEDLDLWWRGHRDAAKLREAFVKILQALQALHRRGLVHGDIKPANIVVQGDTPRLIDFGFAALRGTGGARGTPAFMAPEVGRGEAPGPRSDLFSLGASFLRMLAGDTPDERPPSPEKLAGGHPGMDLPFAQVLARLVEADPLRRPESPANALELLGAAEPCPAWEGPLPFVGRENLTGAWAEALGGRSPGPVWIVCGPEGWGKSFALLMLKWLAQLRGRRAVLVEGSGRQLADAAEGKLPGNPDAVLLVDNVAPLDGRDARFLERAIAGAASHDPALVVACEENAATRALQGKGAAVFSLGPLDARAVSRVLDLTYTHADRAMEKRLAELSGGVPLLLEKGVEFLSASGCLPSALLGEDIVPRGFWEERTARLEPEALEALRWLAAFDRPIPETTLAGLLPPEGSRVAEGLVDEGLAVREGGSLRLCSGSLRAFLEADGAAMAPKHRRILEMRGLPKEEKLLRGLLSGGQASADELARVTRSLLLAGKTGVRSKILAAALSSPGVTAGEKERLAFLLIDARVPAGRAGELRRLLDSPPARHLSSAGRAYFEAWIAYMEGDSGKAGQLVDRLLPGSPDGEVRGCAVDLRLRLLVKTGRYGEAVEEGERMLPGLSGHPAEASVLFSMARADYYRGKPDGARRRLNEGLTRAASERDAIVGKGLLGLLENAAGSFHDSRRRYEEALALVEGSEEPDALLEGSYRLNLGLVCFQLGRIGRSLDLLEGAAAIARRTGQAGLELTVMTNLAGFCALLGREAEMRRNLSEARRMAARFRMGIHLAQCDLVEAEHGLEGGAEAEARDFLRRAREGFSGLGVRERLVEVLLVEGLLESRLGDRGRLAAVVEELERGDVPVHLQDRLCFLRSDLAGTVEEKIELLWEAHRRSRDWHFGAMILARLSQLYEGQGRVLMARAAALFGHALLARAVGGEADLDTEAFWAPSWRGFLRDAAARQERERGDLETWTLRQVLELQKKIVEEEDPGRLPGLIMDAAVAITGAERGFLVLREGRGEIRVAVARNIDRESIRKPEFKISRTVAEKVLETGVPLLSVSAQDDKELSLVESVHVLGLKSVLCVPVRGRESIRGAVYLDNRFVKGTFSRDSMQAASTLADTLAVALENIELRGRLLRKTGELEEQSRAVMGELRRRELEVFSLKEEVSRATGSLRLSEKFPSIVGRSRAMEEVLALVEKIAPSTLPVVIEGETGSGKELVARAVHEASPRRERPFVAVNCGALPETLLESELFGYVRGAFTGAAQDRRGLLREAAGGSLFLDELEAMSPGMQTKLLRVVETGEVVPVGSEKPFRADIRLIAAANVPLARLREQGRLREDLFYRLNVIRVRVPPLRARKEDVPVLVEFFLQKGAAMAGTPRKAVAREALRILLDYDWPGNVRQLENVILAASLSAEGDTVLPSDLPEEVLGADLGALARGRLKTLVAESERELVTRTLREAGGNKHRAARLLGISRPTLYRKLRRLGMPLTPGG